MRLGSVCRQIRTRVRVISALGAAIGVRVDVSS